MADTSINKVAAASFLKGGGEMGKLIRSKDWSNSVVGEPDEWPQSLRTALSILLNSKFPMYLFWGPDDLIGFYNDAYRPSLGNDGKHPHILGMRGEQAWPEIWEIIKPLIDQVLSGGEATWSENQLIPIYRNGKIEDVYWTFSYSPVNDESGNVSGVFVTCNETTQQVINLKKLEESERDFRNLINQAPVPAALYKGNDFIIELANEEILKVWGKNEQVIGRRLIEAIPELKNQPFIGLMEEVYDTGIPYEGKEVPAQIERNGVLETAYFNLIYKRIHSGDWKTGRILAMGYDVTEQLMARRKIEEADKKFRNMVMQAPVGITIFSGKDFIVEMANETYEQIIGIKEKDLLGKPFLESVPEVKDVVEPLLRKVMETGTPYYGIEFEIQLNRYGKIEKTYFNFTYQPLREEDGSISGVMVVANEVTAQVEGQQALRESEKQFSRIVMQSPIAMTVWRGGDYIIEMANTELLKNIWRREAHEVLGKKALEVFPELIGQKYPELLEKVYTTGKSHRENESIAWVEGQDGMKRFYLDFEYSPLLEQDGTVSGIMITVYDVTEKVEARKRILDAEERLRIAVHASGLGTFESNIQTGEIAYSDRYLEIMGFDPGYHPTHKEIVEKVHSDDLLKRDQQNQKAYETGTLDYELRIVPQKNTIGWIRAKGKVLYDDQNNPLKISGGIIDITHEKITRELIEESEFRLQQLADSMPQLVWMAGANGAIFYFNHRLSEYRTERTGDHWQWAPLLHPEDIAATVNEWNHALEEKHPYAIEHRLNMADGSWRWHLSRAYPQFDEEGAVVKWFGTATDIQILKESEEKFRSLSNSVPQHVWTADAEGNLNYYNQSVFDYSGLTLKDIQEGGGWLQIVHPDDREENILKWTEAIHSGRPFLFEHRFRRYDGEYRWQLSRALPQKDSYGKIQMWVGTSTDIDDIKKHEQLKDDFIKMASHELKTPVTSIKGYVQLLQKIHEHDGSTMLNTYLSTIDKQVSKLTNLITDLLDVTKIETGTLSLNKQTFPINELVKSIAEDMQHTSLTHHILVEEKTNQHVFADRDRISQVLINYITNAIKYSPNADKIIIGVSSEAADVIVSVKDFGIGITPKDHDKIFERFYRVQGKEEQTFPGFGIGLYIVQEIIGRHNGKTWLESEKDKGSVFYFSLPLYSL